MPALSFFLDADDLPSLVAHLDDDEEIAFLVGEADGPGQRRWRAVGRVGALADGDHALWHVPAGTLSSEVADPWAGWRGRVAATAGLPFLTSWEAAFRLTLNTRTEPYSAEERARGGTFSSWWCGSTALLVCSGLQWVGARYRQPHPRTVRWWSRFRAWLKRTGIVLIATPKGTFYAFPSAHAKLLAGMPYEARGFDLGAALGRR